jgi:hypothetical protein
MPLFCKTTDWTPSQELKSMAIYVEVLDCQLGTAVSKSIDWTPFSIGEEREIILNLGMLARHTIWHAPQF